MSVTDKKVLEKKIEIKEKNKEECLKLKLNNQKNPQTRNEPLVNANYPRSERLHSERSPTNGKRESSYDIPKHVSHAPRDH